MTFRRYRHSSVLLTNHKVLVFGGYGGTGSVSSLLDSAEVYDPASGTWSATGKLKARRSGPGVCILGDGRVLVSGGTDELNRRLKSAEIYNPSTGGWSFVAGLIEARSYHTQTRLPDGRVLVTGGSAANREHLSSCEIYDPAANSWKQTASMIAPRFWHQATLLKSGNVLITGNHYVADIISPKKGASWYTWDGVADYRFNHTATLLVDGRVLIAGGSKGLDDGLVTRAEIYDPALDAARPEIEVFGPEKRVLASGKGTTRFDPVRTGTAGKAQVFRIKNVGNLPLKGLSVDMQGADKDSFQIGRFSKTTIAPDESATLRITFRPTRKGSLRAVLRIRSNDADETPFLVKFVGKGR